MADSVHVVSDPAPFEVAFRASPAAMAISSLADTCVLDANAAALRLLGCTRDQLVGQRGDVLQWLIDPADRARCAERLASDGSVHELATQLRNYAGERLDVVLSIQPVTMFDQSCALTVISDVTALRSTQRTLEEAQAIGHVGSWSYDVRTGGLEWSQEARRILGVDATAGGDLDWRHLVDLGALASVLAKREQALGETGTFDGEYPIVTSTGERRTVHARGRVEHDAEGNPLRLVGVLQDVTEQRCARDELRRSEALFSTAFRSSPVANGILRNRDMRIVDINEAAASLAGRTRDEVLGRTALELGLWIEPADRTRMLARIAAGDDVRDTPIKVVRKDGEVRIGRMSVEQIQVGDEACMLTAITDVTDTEVMQRRLAASEELYRRIVETTAQGVLTVDGEVLTFVNQRAAALLATTPEALIGKSVFDIIAPEGHDAARARMGRRNAGLTETYDLPFVTATGERVLVELVATPLRNPDGIVEGALAMFSDVRARREAERERARLAAIVESSCDSITSCTPDGTIETWNAGAEQLYGYTAAEAIGMNTVALVPPERRGTHQEHLAQLQRGEMVAVETTCIRKDGTRADIVLTRSPVFDAHRNVIAISSIARDISAQRHAQKMEAIGSLAGGIAHDFNNILSVVLSSTTLIEDALDRHDPIMEDVRAVREAAERAASLTRQLLAFSRRQVLEPKIVNLDRIVGGMEKMLHRLLGERVELAMSTGQGANVMIDPGQFEQVIMNLAVNARDAMPDGGRLTIETSRVTHNDRGYVQVTVADTGVGMDDTTRQRMFEPFFTTKERGKGTGLGLATVFGIVEQSGGFVEVDSARGRGTTIAIFIPRSERTTPAGMPVAMPPPAASRGETILVVEDEELVRRLVMKLLRREGYEVLGAANAGEALLIAEQQREIDLLLTDVVMPIMNGRQLAERLRAMLPGLRVVFMSGYHDDEVLREMAATSGVMHLQKPVPRDVLVEKLREMLDSSIIPECDSPPSLLH